jgi:cobyrinic acid a,c-diamide synthase
MPASGGFVIGAPSSGSGKTTIALGLMRALSRHTQVRPAKSGPDYIDPQFHSAACGHLSTNLDAWAMAPDTLRGLAVGDGLLIVEGAMGLFDGAPPDGDGSAADLAEILDLPVVLVIDAARMSQSIAALVGGFVRHRAHLKFGGIILNKVGSPRHETMLRKALAGPDMPPVLGAFPRSDLSLPSRHLGLVQAHELPELDGLLDQLADLAETHIDLSSLAGLGAQIKANTKTITPPAQRIAVAQDIAFAFSYPHMLSGWRDAGAEIETFSPLADDPVPDADFVFLPGGYPELHAGRLAGNTTFINSLNNASQTSDIYGECGGYMMLGDGLVDADGTRHQMAGLLRLETSFAQRQRHLGYRQLTAHKTVLAGDWRGHEFHYATTINAQGPSLFDAADAEGSPLPPMGLRHGRVCGSFAHLISSRVA